MRRDLIYLFILLIIPIYSCDSFPASREVKQHFYLVIKVIDGDTFWVDNGSDKGIKVRLIGVDAPESRNTGRKEKAYFGEESKDYLTRLITGKKVRLDCDVDSLDQYGRTLAYVYLENGRFVNDYLVKNGYAMVMTIPPNVKYADTFLKHARKARKQKRGLWADEMVSGN